MGLHVLEKLLSYGSNHRASGTLCPPRLQQMLSSFSQAAERTFRVSPLLGLPVILATTGYELDRSIFLSTASTWIMVKGAIKYSRIVRYWPGVLRYEEAFE